MFFSPVRWVAKSFHLCVKIFRELSFGCQSWTRPARWLAELLPVPSLLLSPPALNSSRAEAQRRESPPEPVDGRHGSLTALQLMWNVPASLCVMSLTTCGKTSPASRRCGRQRSSEALLRHRFWRCDVLTGALQQGPGYLRGGPQRCTWQPLPPLLALWPLLSAQPPPSPRFTSGRKLITLRCLQS